VVIVVALLLVTGSNTTAKRTAALTAPPRREYAACVIGGGIIRHVVCHRNSQNPTRHWTKNGYDEKEHMETTVQQPTHDEIAARAYELWEQRCRPEGCDLVIWLEAERQVRAGVKLYQEQPVVSAQPPHAIAVKAHVDTPSRPAPLARSQSGWRAGIKAEGQAKPRTPRRTIPPARQAKPGRT